MSIGSVRSRRAAAGLLAASVIAFAGGASASADDELSLARAESFNAARAKCVKKLRESCYPQHLQHIRGGRCWVFRGTVTGRVGRTYGCPGSPQYVF